MLEGLTFPIQLNKRNDLATGTGDDLDITNLTFLFGIKKGECPWDGDFGMELHRLKHMKMANLVSKAVIIRQATDQVNKYAKQFIVTNADPAHDGDEAKVSIEVAERAKMTNRLTIFAEKI
jgi:hypothetical protein